MSGVQHRSLPPSAFQSTNPVFSERNCRSTNGKVCVLPSIPTPQRSWQDRIQFYSSRTLPFLDRLKNHRTETENFLVVCFAYRFPPRSLNRQMEPPSELPLFSTDPSAPQPSSEINRFVERGFRELQGLDRLSKHPRAATLKSHLSEMHGRLVKLRSLQEEENALESQRRTIGRNPRQFQCELERCLEEKSFVFKALYELFVRIETLLIRIRSTGGNKAFQ